MPTKEAIQSAIEKFEQRMMQEKMDLTLAEYVKLLQISQELIEEGPKEIKVSWVGTEPKSNEE